EMVNDASSYLYEATNNRAFFKDVTILIPDTWPDKPDYQSPGNSTFEGADIIIAPRNPRFAPTPVFPPAPHTKHYEGCGKQAAYIHLTSHFLLNETSEELYGNKGLAQFYFSRQT
ncbi:putative calcium-activated chloride channel regulator 1, partial [Apostichopus japonicus]